MNHIAAFIVLMPLPELQVLYLQDQTIMPTTDKWCYVSPSHDVEGINITIIGSREEQE